MPEELGIALVVLFVIGFVLCALVGGVLRVLSTAHEELQGLVAQRSARRFEKNKGKFIHHVHMVLPNELGQAARTVNGLQAEFERRRAESSWIPLRPIWEKKAFLRQLFSPQSASWKEMNIGDIDSILHPDPVPWFEKESAILAQDCSYPSKAPTSKHSKFTELSVPPLHLEKASFELNESAVRAKDVKRFFRQELAEMEEYNQRRLAINSRYDELKKEIEVWNAEERERWQRYVDVSMTMAREEMNSFRLLARKYSSECNEQKANIGSILEGFRHGVIRSLQEFSASWLAWRCQARFPAYGISISMRSNTS